MKKQEDGRYKIFVPMVVIIGMVIAGSMSMGVLGAGNLPYYDIEQDSLGNYHKAFINDSTGNNEIYYTNDIGGQYPQDWNPPIKISNTTTESLLLDLGIYLPTDTMFIIWDEVTAINATTSTNLTYYTISKDYGANWTEPRRSYEKIMLKYDEFNPLIEGEEPTPPFAYSDADTFSYIYYIVQLKTPLYKEWWDGIEDAGGIFCGYTPNNAYLVWMDAGIRQKVENLCYIRWIGLFHPSYKIQEGLLNETGIIEVNVKVIDEHNKTRNLNTTIQQIQDLGGNITYNGSSNSVIRCQIDVSKIDDIAYLLHVEWIDKYTPPQTLMNNIRHSDYTGANTMHNYGFDGELSDGSKIIGMVKDDGIEQDDGDGGHPDFGNLDHIVGSPLDEAHGTCTFGIVFSDGSNDIDAKGMLPKGSGIFYDWDVTRADSMQTLVDNGGVFQTNSWHQGAPTNDYDSYSEQNDLAVFTHDVSMLYAMGNYGQLTSSDAVAKNVISVGGVYHMDTATLTDDKWDPGGPVQKGSTGPTLDQRMKPDLCGPFDRIYTTDSVDDDTNDGYNSHGIDTRTGNPIPEDPTGTGLYYPDFGGTSGATPVVAGTTGIIYQMYKENHFGNNPKKNWSHASTIKAIQIANAYQYILDPLDINFQATRYQQGWGTPDLERIYNVGSDHFIVNEYKSLEKDEVASYYIYPKSTLSMKISLVWTDPPASPPYSEVLKNNLDLKVTDITNNLIYWGNNGLLTSKWSSSGTGINPWSKSFSYTDERNNVENVFIQTPTQGPWKIEIIADQVQQDGDIDTPLRIDQHFGLVVSYEPFYKEVTLYPGWNLISFPLIQSPRIDQPGGYNYRNSERLEDVLRSIGNNYDALQYFDASDGDWKHWHIDKPDHLNDLKVLGHRMGFWIYVIGISAPDTITLRVFGWEFTSDQEIELWDGWNMVGYPSTVIQDRYNGLNNLEYPRDIDAIQYFDGQSKTWKFMENPTDEFGIGVGYWMHYKDDVQGNPVNWVVKYII